MNRKLLVITLFAMLTAISGIHAQLIDSLLGVYDAKVPQEKIHIHFDNHVYTPGQTIWFKAYLMKGVDLSDVSKNFYIDWFDTYGKFLNRTITPIIGASASGSFAVPEKFSGSGLQVLAYTKWMLNFDSAFLFHQTISIVQPAALPNSQQAIVPVTTLQFFPEGGDMVENISSIIAFKAINTAGLPVNVSGKINNKNGQAVANFSTEHDGMGKVYLVPAPGEAYTAEWKDPLGITQFTQLPLAKTKGIVLSVHKESGSWSFSVERAVTGEQQFKKVIVVATMYQHVVFRAVVNFLERKKVTAHLPVIKFPSGVLQLTIFDINQQPIAERVLFVNNEEYRLQADIHFDTLSLEKRGKNVYVIDVPDSIATSLSLAITDGEEGYDTTRNILSQLLLSGEIKGHIHNPAYYFSSTDDRIADQLDLVMLTNGWRRFIWEHVLQSKTPLLTYLRDTGFLSIEGKIDKLSDGKIKRAEFVNLILTAKDSSKQFIFAPLKADGSFGQDNLILFDTTKVFFQLNRTALPGRSTIHINNNFLPFDSTRRLHNRGVFLSDTSGLARIKSIADEQKRADELMKQATLKEVIVRTKVKPRREELNDMYTGGLFREGQSRDFNIVDDKQAGNYQSVFAFLQAKVAGLQINNAYSPNPSATWRRATVSFFLDEFPVDAATIASIPMTSIAYIKAFDPPFFGATGGGAGGAVAVYTKKGEDTKNMSFGLDHTLLPGYTPFKQFYSPNYAELQVNFSQADLRRTLYWNPYIHTDAGNKKVVIAFYNNDISHTLQLVLEGLADDGRMIHFNKLLK